MVNHVLNTKVSPELNRGVLKERFHCIIFYFSVQLRSNTNSIYSINRPGRLLHFWTLRVGAYSRWALIRGWALIRINTVSESKIIIIKIIMNLIIIFTPSKIKEKYVSNIVYTNFRPYILESIRIYL